MTDNEIIKTLKCCGENSDCEKCPYFKNKHYLCGKSFNTDVLDLINRQKAEIESLKTENKVLGKTYIKCQIATLKEFAERLKKEKFTEHFCGQKYDLIHSWIDNLVKEMVGE